MPIIEGNDYNELDSTLEEYLSSTQESDALILGCTHYPIIKKYIEKKFDGDIICLDKFVVDIVSEFEISKNDLKLYFSKVDKTLEDNVKRILEIENIKIERQCL